MKKGINYLLINCTFFILCIYLLDKLNILKDILSFLLLIILSLIVSYILHPIYKKLSNRFNNIISISITYIMIIIILFILIYLIIPNTYLINKLSDLLNNILIFINEINNKYNLNINIDTYINRCITIVLNNTFKFMSYLSKSLFILVLSICILLNIDILKKFINKLKYKDLIISINEKLNNYLIATLKIIVIQFIEYTLLFLLIGHPDFLLLGILNSLNTIIPIFGSIITNVVALITSSVISKKLFILTAIISIIMPNIDAYLVSPHIYKKTASLPKTLTITSVIVFGLLFGVLGIIFAVPILIILLEVIEYKNKL